RMRRIFPALFFMLFACTTAARLLLPPEDLADYGKNLAALGLLINNIFFLQTAPGDGYFDIRVQTQALLHSWSLSVEEQFYLLLPVSLVLIHLRASRYLKPALILAAIASFALGLFSAPVTAFYLLPTRAWELLIGSLLAVRLVPRLPSRIS